MGNSAPKGTKSSGKGKNVKNLRSQFAQMEKDHKQGQNTLTKKSKKKFGSSKPKPKPKPKAQPKSTFQAKKTQPEPKKAAPAPPSSRAPPPGPAASSSVSTVKPVSTFSSSNTNNKKKWGASSTSTAPKTSYKVNSWKGSSNANNAGTGAGGSSSSSKPVNSSSSGGNSKFVSANAKGLTRELQEKQVFKYDFAKEKVVLEWVSTVSGSSVSGSGPDKVQSQLQDGVVLCKLVNAVLGRKAVPDTMMKSKNPYAKNERIGKFIEQSKGILRNAPFEVNDLHNPSGHVNITAVIDGLYSLGLACNKSNQVNVAKMKMPKANTGNRMD